MDIFISFIYIVGPTWYIRHVGKSACWDNFHCRQIRPAVLLWIEHSFPYLTRTTRGQGKIQLKNGFWWVDSVQFLPICYLDNIPFMDVNPTRMFLKRNIIGIQIRLIFNLRIISNILSIQLIYIYVQ